jgi:hypothetical protein
LQRGCGTLSAKEGERGIPHRTVNKQARPEKAGVVAHTQQPGAGKPVKVVEGGKLHRKGGKTHFPHEL